MTDPKHKLSAKDAFDVVTDPYTDPESPAFDAAADKLHDSFFSPGR